MDFLQENNLIVIPEKEGLCDDSDTSEIHESVDGVVSFQTEIPLPLQTAMSDFIERYPNWDQYRLIQAALAGFLVQNGVDSRSITRLYIGNMFSSESFFEAPLTN